MTQDFGFYIAVALIFTLAGVVKGALGLGLPTVAMGLLGLMMPPAMAAGLLLVPSLLTNVWQAVAGGAAVLLIRRLWPLLLATGAATFFSAPLLAHADPRLTGTGLGVALFVYGISGLMKWQFTVPARAEPWAGVATGIVTGVITGATGVFVMPAVPYIAGLGFERDRLVQALGLFFTVSTMSLGLGLWWWGALEGAAGVASVIATGPALVGMAIGGALRSRISPATFRFLFFVALTGLGVHGIWRGI